jgi:hypothetical protein
VYKRASNGSFVLAGSRKLLVFGKIIAENAKLSNALRLTQNTATLLNRCVLNCIRIRIYSSQARGQ